METIRLACSVERMTLKDADSAESVYLVCPKIDGPETIARAELTFSGSEPSDDGYFSLRLEGIEDTFVANYRGNGTYVADLSRIYAAVKKSEAKRLLLRWIPGKEMGVCPVVAASGDKAATLALAVSSTRPFVPIASFSTSDGSTLSVGALDGRELYSRPIFRNVFGYPVTIYYDSSIANSASHIRLPKGIRLSFLQSFDGSTWTKGDGERVAFVNASGSTSVKFDAKGSGLYAKQVDELWRIVDAYTGGYAVFNSSGYLTRVVDGYGSTLLSVTRSLLSATATDQFGNTVSLSTNKLILNGGTHVLSFSKSSGYLSSITYSKGTADAGESIQFSCDATGASSIREPSGEVLRANFLSDGRVSAILKGVLQGTSFETENRLDIAYDDQQASCTNLRGRKTDVTFDDADRVETVGDDTGGLRSIFPAGNRTFAGFASTEYLRKMLGSYPVEMYGSSSSIAIEQGQVPVLAGHMMEPGRRYCVMATVDFSSSAVPDGSSRSFVISPNFTYGSGMSLSLNFSSGHGTVRTLYGFVEPTASAGLLSVAVVFSGMPGVATIKSLSVVACSYNDFCYVDSSGSIGPFFGTKWSKRSATNAYGYRYSSGFENGYITPEDAKANALLSLRGEGLFFHSGLTQLRVGDFGYGSSFPKTSPSSATLGTHSVSTSGADMMQRIRVINGAVEESVSVFADGVERKRGRTEDTSGTVLSEVSPTGGSRSQVDSRGRLVSLTEVSTSLSDGEQRTYDYSGNDPRPIAVTDYWTAISLQYASDSLNLETISSSSSLWGGTEHYGHSPRDEYLSYFSKGSTSIASVFAGAHLSSLSQGAGSIGLTYGIGGLTIAAYSGVYLEYRTHSFSTSSSSYRCLYGSNGGIRLFYTPYDRPYEAYRVSSSGSETKIASWTYGFSDSDTESAASPIRSYHDLVLGTVDVQELAPAERKATVTRTDGAGARGGVFTRVWDERGRTNSLVFALSGRNLTLTHSFTYPAGTTAPSSMTGTITDNSLTCYYGNSVTYDAFGRVSTVPSSFDGVGVERRLTYFHGIPSSVKTTCTYGGSSVIATESLSIDGAKRIKQVVLSDAGNTFTSSFKRDDEGRIIREDNPFFGHTYVYSYSPSGCIKEVKRGTYSDADSPSVFPWRSFEYSATWGPLLTSVDGVAVTNASGYPTLIQGNALSWEAGRLLGYGSSTFGYDAQGNCVSRSGGSGSSTFVYDPSGRLLEEVCSSYSIAFIYGLSGLIGFRVRSGSAAGNYTYRYDALGNVAAIVGPSGVAARYAYDAFGNGKVCDANWQENASDQFVGNINPIRYKGGLFDRGTGLYRFGSRWYAPFLYRWLSPDGAEYLDGSRVDGANPYAYCYNDPVTYVDADGHFPILAGILLGLGVLTLTGAGLLIGGRVSGNDILVNAGDSILSGVEMAAGVALIVFCPSSLIGVGILGVGIGSFTNGLINMSNGGSYHAGWAGGQLAGGLSFIPYFGGPIGAFFGSAFTDLIDGEYDITAIDWWKAGFTGAISFGLSWLNITVNWGASSGLYSLGRAANLVSAYDYALLSISGGILNAWWRGKRKPI